ncbi:RluA family pseudouridine synthase [Thaumasiovibrio subtropicus]|uniref:RluA family pseudouridine synthase n=1 Tax=Thaumasiovibrio subtropicus TaxID=1891207 RepID=UPI000B362102|nr:RluA family pseudouridine synthase [Thaumasiovibrio subtropicus]
MQINYYDDIPDKHNGTQLIDYLQMQFPYANQPWASLFAQSRIKIDGLPAQPSNVLTAKQHLSISFTHYTEAPVDTEWRLLWHKKDVIAVHKPATLPVSRTTRNIYNTLIALIKRESDWPDAHLLHRLDLETSGIVLLGKHKQAAAKWQPELNTLMTAKRYHAVVYGSPAWTQKEVMCHLATRPTSPIRCQMHVCEPGEKGKLSQTRFTVIERGEHFSVVECELVTGRKHQIRAHLAHIGHPIVGDKIYANMGHYYLKRLADAITPADEEQLLAPYHLLFAREVTVNLSAASEDRHVIINPFYPSAWRRFCEQHRLTTGVVKPMPRGGHLL